MSKLRLLASALLVMAAACTPARDVPPGAGTESQPALIAAAPKPGFPSLGSALPAGHTRFSNESLARLFAVMTHELEGRARRPHLVRYQEPISVAIEGAGAAHLNEFLDGYLALIRKNSGVDITRSTGAANLHVRLVDGKRFAKEVPSAVCVIAGGDLGWAEFADNPLRASASEVARATRIDQMTIFIPDTARPHQSRNCLLEEVPQALGLSNDLYGLGMSSFNDDGAHLWPTKLDYLMLRVLYSPEMAVGLDRRATEARALVILNRINPAGLTAPPLPVLRQRAMERWSMLIARVFSRDSSENDRLEDIDKALILVEAKAPGSAQHCHTLVTAGRALSRPDPERAVRLLDYARSVCDRAHGVSDVRLARIRLETACALSRLGRYDEVISTTESVWPVLAAHGQDERLAALYTLQSDALAATVPGSMRAASVARLANEWNAYAVGPGRRAAGCRKKA
jgi:hypothetical protein